MAKRAPDLGAILEHLRDQALNRPGGDAAGLPLSYPRERPAGMESIKRFRRRTHRCFELAGQVMLREASASEFVLVHGVTSSMSCRSRTPGSSFQTAKFMIL